MKVLSDLKKYPSAFTSIGPKLTAFLKAENYSNFSVSSATEGGSDKNPSYDPTRDLTKDNAKLAIAGAVDVALTDDSARVSVGKYADIVGTGATSVKAELDRTDSALNGNLGFQTGDQNAVGGVVSFFKAERDASVAFAENTAAKGSSLAVKAENKTNHIDLATGASVGGNSGVKGMITYVKGNDTAKVDIKNNTNLISGGAMDITSHNTATITNIAGSFGLGDAAGVGASVAVNDLQVVSSVTAGVADITAGSLTAKSGIDGTINSAAVAGGFSSSSDEDEAGTVAKFTTGLTNTKNKISDVVRNANNKLFSILPDKLKEVAKIEDNKFLATDHVAKNSTAGKALPSVSVGGAGSVAVNLLDRTANTAIDGATINFTGQGKNLDMKASDSGFVGAWAGGAGMTFNTRSTEQNENSSSVGIAGAVGWSAIHTETVSALRNATVKNVNAITNVAERTGADVSAGIGLAVSQSDGKASGGSSYTGAASVSVADIDNTIKAELANNTVTEGGSVTNTSTDADTLVAGGINASIAIGKSKSMAFGGSVIYNRVTNDIDALVTGGSYDLSGSFTNKVGTKITEVGATVGVAVASSSKAYENAYGFEGVAAYNAIKNNAVAKVSGVMVTAKNVTVDARDTVDTSKKYDEYISSRGLDATGASYIENLKDALDSEGKANASSSGGNTVVGAAVGVAASVGDGGAGAAAALAITEVDNDFTATIEGDSKLNLNNGSLSVKSDSRTLMVNAAAGGGGSSDGFGGAGSFSWQTDSSTVTAKVENSKIKNAAISVIDAGTSGKDINVAGQVSAGQKAAGLAGAYNRLENTTQAISAYVDYTGDTARTLSIGGHNEGRVYAVTAGVSLSREGAANGAVAINSGADDIKAELSGGSVENAASVSVTSSDNTKKLAVSGGFTASMGAAIGGAVAYNAIGDTKRQANSALIKNTTITGTDASRLAVTATDNSGLTTIGFGTSLALGEPAANGAAAVGLANKDVTAQISGSTIKNIANGASVKASTDDDFSTTAAVVAVGETVAAGVGVAVTRDNTHTTAKFSGGSFAGGEFTIDAASHADITTAGAGGGVNYGIGLGLAGSVAVNTIGTETKALLDGGANIAAKAPAITAASDEKIANYAGALSVSVNGAAIGASVSVNEIGSETEAAIEGAETKVRVTGDAARSVKDSVKDSDILDNYVDKDNFNSAKSLKDVRTAQSYNGLLVDASGTHTMKSFLVNAAGTGIGAGINGTVDVNLIGGFTKARIAEARINTAASDKSNVNVIAHDYANSAGIVGTANIALVGAAVGLGSDTSKITRTTEASFVGPESKYGMYANDVNIEAKSRQGIGSLAAGGSVAAKGAGVSAATGVTLLDGVTNAFLKNVNIMDAGNISVVADHLSRSHVIGVVLGAAGIGAGVGISVGYVADTGTTEAAAENIGVTFAGNDTYNFGVKAKNDLKITYMEVGLGGAGLGVGALASGLLVNAFSKRKKKEEQE